MITTTMSHMGAVKGFLRDKGCFYRIQIITTEGMLGLPQRQHNLYSSFNQRLL